MLRRTGIGLAIVGIFACAIAVVDPYYRAILAAPFQPSFWEVVPTTLSAAVRVWGFWGMASAICASLLLRHTTVGTFDSVLMGALAPWVASLFVGTLVAPLGLLSGWSLWLTLLGGAAWCARHPPVRPRLRSTSGQRLLALAAVLAVPAMFLEQLGSPVPPHFDVFAPLAAAQRIVTFGYLPFDTDAYGYYGRAAGMPGVELFYAMLTLGGGVADAGLAASATIVPMAVLLLAVTYRLGFVIAGDRCGGFAALLLLNTMLLHVLPYGHGRYVSFVPALAGLAYVVDAHPVRRVAGGLLLATAIACHAIIGSFAMGAAVVGGLPMLFGASIMTLPAVLVAVGPTVPALALTALHAAGFAILVLAAVKWRAPSGRLATSVASIAGRIALVVLGAVIIRHPPETLLAGFVECWRFPVLLPLALVGTVIHLFSRWPMRRALLVAPCLVGIAAAVAGQKVSVPGLPWVAHDFTAKAEFWLPLSLCLPAAAGLAWLARWSTGAVLVPLLALLIVPWAPRTAAALGYGQCAREEVRDPNYNAVAWIEHIGQYLAVAKNGYWNPRWAKTPAEEALYELLRAEVAAGRLTADVHIPHVAPIVYMFQDTILYSVFVGIHDDLYMADYQWNASIDGGRVRPIQEAAAAIAKRPPYVVIHERTHSGHALKPEVLDALPLDGYEVMMNDDGVRLLRWAGT